ncbi:PREDICTED: myb family transcription factor PHL8-like isoform X2 [Lupinus angustifolius]|uniref:myb family transcription factor PHL8-like isoform X2 n=1 Tax=Lupinus angustifolius TaxID=3871 RepID=UPI00092E9D35|nr:PREDICTED: myb family transcription factor PHL8-like isoform X2 [Lupinus angustifolius]
MDQQNMQNQCVHFVLSTDAKPRLKWTPELHQRFTDATNQLGGPEKATPKSLMRVMGVPGLTLYHLKSHLQKYRLGKTQQVETCSENKQKEIKSSDDHCSKEINVGAQNQIAENLQIAKALQMQMEVQRKLHEQIEVQKNLQLKIEAQGQYLQSVLKKAHEALGGYNSSKVGIELTKAELSHLVTIINNASPISELTETKGLSLSYGERKQDRGTMCSLESSLTSSESSERKEVKNPMEFNTIALEMPLMEIKHGGKGSNGRKRSGETDSDGSCVEQPCGKKCAKNLEKPKLLELIDLNNQYDCDMGSGSKTTLDLNCSSSFWET